MKKHSLKLALTFTALMTVTYSAHAQFFGGIMGGVTSVIRQIGGKVGDAISGARPEDLQAKRDTFFAKLDMELAGVDGQARQQLTATANSQWATVEQGLLIQNANLQKKGLLVDFTQVAKDAASGATRQLGINSAFGTSSITDVISSSAMDGVIAGVADDAPINGQAARAQAYTVTGMGGASSMPAAVNANVNAVVAGGVGTVVSSAVKSTLYSGAKAYQFPDVADPRKFLGKEPAILLAKDLYRENGFLGWKLIDGSMEKGVEAFAPVLGDPDVKGAVYTFDKSSGAVTAAFRVLNAPPSEFTKVVEGLEEYLKEKSLYASSGVTLRAVWENGVFVTADTTRLSVGWSSLVKDLYKTALARDGHGAQ